jgi:hypothetical protein
MSVMSDLKMYGRFTLGLRGYLARPLTLEEAAVTIKKRMDEREEGFIRLVKRGIFGHPGSPYLPLMRLAGCEEGDIRGMVRKKGLEETLLALRESGVYITFEEFKGRRPLVRQGLALPVRPGDFDNPFLSRHYYTDSGGTTGPGSRVSHDLDHLAAQAPNQLVGLQTHDVLGFPQAFWQSILPASAGINSILRGLRLGHIPRKWFTPVTPADLKSSIKYRLATRGFISLARLYGFPLPYPEPLPLEEAAILARWAGETIRSEGHCLIRTMVSLAQRISLAAGEEGIDLTGGVILAGGETPTPAKVRTVKESGARWIPTYHFTDSGIVGMGCSNPADGNDIHFFKDIMALVQYPRRIDGTGIEVEAFNFTSLLPTAPKIMLNVESDDYGTIERRSCGCPLEFHGYLDHLRHIRSFSKMTGEGMTLVGSDMIRILEEVLPERFGGNPLDYQLREEEDHEGFTRLSLLVSPRIVLEDEKEIIKVFMEAMGRSGADADLARSIWRQAGTMRVERKEPVWTRAGKLMPLIPRQLDRLPEQKMREEP